MWTWGSFVAVWGQQIIATSITVMLVVLTYILATAVERHKAKKYFNLYHDKISKDNVERWKADKQKALEREAKALKLYDELDARYRAAKIMAQKTVEMLS